MSYKTRSNKYQQQPLEKQGVTHTKEPGKELSRAVKSDRLNPI
jgi:hypothetical protein